MKISARLALFAIVVTLAYLGLAVWGMGGFAAFFPMRRWWSWCWQPW